MAKKLVCTGYYNRDGKFITTGSHYEEVPDEPIDESPEEEEGVVDTVVDTVVGAVEEVVEKVGEFVDDVREPNEPNPYHDNTGDHDPINSNEPGRVNVQPDGQPSQYVTEVKTVGQIEEEGAGLDGSGGRPSTPGKGAPVSATKKTNQVVIEEEIKTEDPDDDVVQQVVETVVEGVKEIIDDPEPAISAENIQKLQSGIDNSEQHTVGVS